MLVDGDANPRWVPTQGMCQSIIIPDTSGSGGACCMFPGIPIPELPTCHRSAVSWVFSMYPMLPPGHAYGIIEAPAASFSFQLQRSDLSVAMGANPRWVPTQGMCQSIIIPDTSGSGGACCMFPGIPIPVYHHAMPTAFRQTLSSFALIHENSRAKISFSLRENSFN